MTALPLLLALSLTTAQVEGAAPEAPAEGAAAAHQGHAAEGGHAAGHGDDMGTVMMHHVTDSHVLELPWLCARGEAQGYCEIELDHVFGTTRDEATGKAISGPLVVGGVDLTPTKHVVMLWLGSLILLVVAITSARKRSLVPRGGYNFVEVLVAFVRNEIAVKNIGQKDADRFTPYLVTAFFFILFLNLLGLVPFAATATANISVTVMLALFTFFITQYAAIRSMGLGGFLSHLTGGVPRSLWPLWFIMVPVETMGLFTKPFALTVRLFANMVAGHFVILALLGLIFVISPWVFFGAVPMALAIFLLELFVAFVQAYIFTMLSSLFIGAGLVHHGDHGDHGGHGEAHAGPGMGSEHGAHGSHVAGTSPGHG
ncbi:MAG: F0F1 ATP synthase subunit A [Anaeromyxobacter sp.]